MGQARKPAAEVKVEPVRPVLPRRWWAWALVLVAVTCAALLHVRSRLVVVQLGYGLGEATSENRRLRGERRKLLVEAATLKSPRRLRKLALERLGLGEPTAEQVFFAPGAGRGTLAMRP